MFSKSEITKNYKCGNVKTAYLTKFGLASYIIELLVADGIC